MTYPSDNHREVRRGVSIERDRHIVNGSILAIVAFAVIVIGVVWFALTGDLGTSRVSSNTPALERSGANGTTGYGGAHSKLRVPNAAPSSTPQK
jgi:uncharacterized iron-regulated membrane protein